jgi:hypothetical protein
MSYRDTKQYRKILGRSYWFSGYEKKEEKKIHGFTLSEGTKEKKNKSRSLLGLLRLISFAFFLKVFELKRATRCVDNGE